MDSQLLEFLVSIKSIVISVVINSIVISVAIKSVTISVVNICRCPHEALKN